MREKHTSNERKKIDRLLKKNVANILVANHIYEPYILSFRYSGENVAAQALGTLVGFFEIEIHDQDAAYIVNFLASVAKKEYFANVRRGPVESFEAALHKINVALSELVKHGNVSWLGHLHGALAILVGHELHFSVTGDASLFLARNGAVRSISEGLADNESEPHPLKTFVEVAGGDLFLNDRIFLLSSSIWTLFTPSDLEKSVNRFSPEALEQFLKTALVNELDSAALLLISCEEEIVPQLLRQKETPKTETPTLQNVFSQNIFLEKQKVSPTEKKAPQAPKKDSEFVDSKTGHIYIQGESPSSENDSPLKEKVALLLESISFGWRRLLHRSTRSSRRWKREIFTLFHTFRSQWKNTSTVREEETSEFQAPEEILPLEVPPLPEPNVGAETPHLTMAPSEERPVSPVENLPSSSTWKVISQKTCAMVSSLANWTHKGSQFLLIAGKQALQNTRSWWKTCPFYVKKYTLLGLGGAALLIFGTIFFLSWKNSSLEQNAPVATPNPSENQVPSAPNPSATSAALPGLEEVLAIPSGETLISLTSLGSTPWAITNHSLYNLSTQERYSAPETIRLEASMEDLQTLFLVSTSGKVFAFTPSNKRFTENILPLPAGSSIESVGAYLTYLYVLDSSQSKIYRFPRAEGGFGSPTSWLKESASLTQDSLLAVNDILVVAQKDSLTAFSRGKAITKNFSMPSGPINIAQITIASGTNEITALDTTGKRLLHWDSNGKLSNEMSLVSLSSVGHFSLNSDQKTALIESDLKVMRFTLP